MAPTTASRVSEIVFVNVSGYCGYIPGVKSENVFGESYGKSSGQSGRGEITRGFDLDPTQKFQSVAQHSFQNQRELQAKLRAASNASPTSQSGLYTIDVSISTAIRLRRRCQSRFKESSSDFLIMRSTLLPSRTSFASSSNRCLLMKHLRHTILRRKARRN